MYRFLPLIVSLLVIGFTSFLSVPWSPFLISGMTQADISAKYPTPITPAGFTFSIWSLIYLSWIIGGIYFIRNQKDKHLRKGHIAFLIAQVLTWIWLIPWGFEWMWTAFFVMLIILVTLWYSYFHSKKESSIQRWSIELTMGWIHIATFANLAVLLRSLWIMNWTSWDLFWGILVLTLAFGATLYFALRYHTLIVSLVFLWAALGIYFWQPYSLLILILLFYSSVIFIISLWQGLRR